MENKHNKQIFKFGLIGKHIAYSFSKAYFTKKFETADLAHSYVNFDIDSIESFTNIINQTTTIKGLNVTIPYKETIIPFLDKLDKKAKEIGAVNTIKLTKKGKLVGYNTDYYGFKNSIKPVLKPYHKKALILGTGGASKAVAYVLKQLNISFSYVSRTKRDGIKFTYETLNKTIINDHQIIINCTPLGTFPNITECPNIPYEAITHQHILYDLIYNPEQTQFLKNGNLKQAITINGLKMLELQAEKAWEIWNT